MEGKITPSLLVQRWGSVIVRAPRTSILAGGQPTIETPSLAAARADHRRTAINLLYILTTAGTRIDVLVLLPFEVTLVLPARSSCPGDLPGGNCRKIRRHTPCTGQPNNDRRLQLVGTWRDAIGLRAETSQWLLCDLALLIIHHMLLPANQQQWPSS